MSFVHRTSIRSVLTRAVAPLAVVLAVGGVSSQSLAQGNAAPAVKPQATATAPAPAMNIRQIYDRVEGAGYTDIREIEWDDGRYEVRASNAQGQRVKLYVNATTGAVEHTKLKR